jgi:molecular chaperone IbpA
MSGALLVPMLLKENVAMRTYDFAPLWRSSVGFDRLFDLINDTQRLESQDNYPPYDIVRTGEDTYRIALALAGFAPDEVTITAQQNKLTIAGRKGDHDSGPGPDQEFFYQGISARPFERQFNLEDHVEVERASFQNGLLQVELARKVPEAMKPRRIGIETGAQAGSANRSKTIDQVRAVS